jgi:hypothetical protein
LQSCSSTAVLCTAMQVATALCSSSRLSPTRISFSTAAPSPFLSRTHTHKRTHADPLHRRILLPACQPARTCPPSLAQIRNSTSTCQACPLPLPLSLPRPPIRCSSCLWPLALVHCDRRKHLKHFH